MPIPVKNASIVKKMAKMAISVQKPTQKTIKRDYINPVPCPGAPKKRHIQRYTYSTNEWTFERVAPPPKIPRKYA